MKTASTNKKVRDLINMVRDRTLVPRPDFQRRLVWTRDDKNRFLDTITNGYPFPEIYIADGDVDVETGRGTQLLVDGQQRITTLVQYFAGDSQLKLTTIKPYKELTDEEKRAFLQYDVSVRDLGSVNRDEIIEVFKRINATKYSLEDIEVNNAIYNGKFKLFADAISQHSIFFFGSTFTPGDLRRMGDLKYALSIIITLLTGYFNRDDLFGDFLDRYNDDFDDAGQIKQRFEKACDLILECGFAPDSRAFKKADLFTLVIEVDAALQAGVGLSPGQTVERMEAFYASLEKKDNVAGSIAGIYYKSALQASNDKSNRLRRGSIVAGLLRGLSEADILENLRSDKLI